MKDLVIKKLSACLCNLALVWAGQGLDVTSLFLVIQIEIGDNCSGVRDFFFSGENDGRVGGPLASASPTGALSTARASSDAHSSSMLQRSCVQFL